MVSLFVVGIADPAYNQSLGFCISGTERTNLPGGTRCGVGLLPSGAGSNSKSLL
jgi:hypothetical protein